MTSLYCHHCIRSFAEDAVFCSQCGRRLHIIAIVANGPKQNAAMPQANESAAALDINQGYGHDGTLFQERENAVTGTVPDNKQPSSWPVIAGLGGLAVVVAACLLMYYQYENKVNEQVLRLQVESKAAALAGHYDQALELIEEAIQARPQFRALAEDQEIVHHAAELERLSDEIRARLTSGDTDAAESELNHLKSELNGRKEPIYDKLKEKADGYSMELTLLELTDDFHSISTIEEHGEMLNVVGGLIGQEAESLRTRIIDGIRSITFAEAEYMLGRRNYSGALSVCNKALTWVKDDAELLVLKERIKAEKETYEREEHRRIEQAMENAAEEDLLNQTDALEVLAVEYNFDEYGNLTINGSLKSKATRSIYNVQIAYSVRGESGELLATGTSNAVPDYVEPGEEMAFNALVPGVYDSYVVVEVKDIEWDLD